MSEDTYRSIGAISGLVIGMVVMFSLGFGGMIPGALFGAGGAVAGGICGEKFYTSRNK